MTAAPAVLVMARAPVAGRAKTRLEPLLGPEGCARLQRELIAAALAFAKRAAPDATYLAADGEIDGGDAHVISQRGGDLGERLREATAEVLAVHDGPLLVIGTDCPQLGPEHAAAALAVLRRGSDAAVIPARDGGYCLVAIAREAPMLFALPPTEWGGPRVLELTLGAARAHGLGAAVLEPEDDLDTPADARVARADPRVPAAVRAALRPAAPLVSVVVPVLNEAAALPGLLDRLARAAVEVVVADGGSADGSAEIARRHPSRPVVCATGPGRARQMNAGAAAAGGDVLLFLHADTQVPDDAAERIVAALGRDPGLVGGNFALRFDGDDGFSRLLGAWYRVQRRTGVYYGDSAVWVRHDVFDELGGYRPLPIMEDYDFVRRLEKRGRTACLPGPAVTSARRWRALGIPRTVLSWVVIRWLFLAGVSPARLARWYRLAR